MTASAIDYFDLGRALRQLGLHLDAAEYHGVLCGMLCVQDSPPENLGLEAEPPPDAEGVPAARELLRALRRDSLAHLHDPESGFMPLLPEDDQSLPLRVDALAQWCQGFLYGLATRPALDLNQASPELREVVSDLIQISHAGVEGDGAQDTEADENAYLELVEYVRAGVQLVFLELRPAEQAPEAPGTLH
ncbi:MAG TPA: YecA family protein [Nevskiales bacterium]|nr:YecA family protein [Nevskiales bacterium]